MSSVASSWVSPEGAIQPFWKRIPKFFAFPSYPAPLVRNIALAVATGVAFAIGNIFVIAPTVFVVAVVLGRYGFLVIERAAQGFLNPADYPQHFEHSGQARPYKMVAVFIVSSLVVGFLGALAHSAFVTFILNTAVSILIPASIMTLALNDDLGAALNPVRLFDLAIKIGKSYLALVLFLLLLMTGSVTAFSLVAPMLRSSVWLLAGGTIFVFNYFFLIMCALMGYVLYQYHKVLDLVVMGDGDKTNITPIDTAARARDAMIAQMVTMGEIKEAITLLSDDLRDRPADLSLHMRLHRLLTVEGNESRIEDHAERYLNLLMKSQNYPEALELVEESQARRPGYQPRDTSHNTPLARAALRAGNPLLAAALIKGFDKKNPMHPDIAAVYFIGAQIMAEAGRNDQHAQRILEHLIEKYPDDAVVPEARKYLDVLLKTPRRAP